MFNSSLLKLDQYEWAMEHIRHKGLNMAVAQELKSRTKKVK